MKNPRFNSINKVSDIVDTMIKGLKREWVVVNMWTFGTEENGICFGCAATNTLCELMQEPFTAETIKNRVEKFNFNIHPDHLESFEKAIDRLREGYVSGFINKMNEISEITGVSISNKQAEKILSYEREKKWWRKERILPPLYTETYKENLIYYEKFRDWLIKKGL